ncbi:MULTISPECIES: host attachment protein [Sinorhizobium]|uniref:Host attachment protein n=3 Tax=Sinorhizobium TaxID=28105 RepID=I3XFW8_SINF2|nr:MULTISPECIES: host attachment family protein [Sinorhizobium]AFL54774.1 hypothetical protein USDA257_p00560 [Sinorhizobium fredii USDA 257]KSV83957.1 hypothetical protein N181_24655 [Sinorhizobium fredii USDA 205]MQX11715.1 host attachment protein [Sinorhizobium fredii]OAP35633.1 hypothetical protein AU381_12035 [Sinorhizobium glycinis]CCE99064.1 hypothetical protein SFHH103_04589 [Sinorhizobium fredii HH103]
MVATRIPHGSWFLICDGAKALILRNQGDAELLNLVPVDVLSEHQPPTRDLGTDRQGRYQAQGGARSAMQETDWHDQAEKAFLAQIAGQLGDSMRDNGVTKLVLVAPPRVLGILRKRLDPSTRAAVSAEVARDLVKFPIPEIEHYLSA